MKLSSKAQSSFELLTTVGFFTLVLATITAYFWSDYSLNSRVLTAEVTVKDIAYAIDEVASMGPGSKKTITVGVPADVLYTAVKDNRVLIKLDTPYESPIDVLEVSKANITGNIPKTQGFHDIVIENHGSGFITVGNGLSISPSYVKVETTQGNSTNITFTVHNLKDEKLRDIRLNVEGDSRGWFLLNRSRLSIPSKCFKKILATATIPDDAIPKDHLFSVDAVSEAGFVQATVDLEVAGQLCGDTLLGDGEMCETESFMSFPKTDSIYCPNDAGIECDAANSRFKASDEFGDCVSGCVCEKDEPEWIGCGTGCVDERYCLKCSHCFDQVRNCHETQVDSGAVCGGVCDGVDDILEGSPCSLGEVRNCTSPGCGGTKTCNSEGRLCRWSSCTSFGKSCSDSICCTCLGNPLLPVRTFNRSLEKSKSDCTQTVSECSNPQSCSGGLFRFECSAVGECSPDYDESSFAKTDAPKLCQDKSCGQDILNCSDQTYPCHGLRTRHLCDGLGGCIPEEVADDSVCGQIQSCEPPQEVVLHKLDINGFDAVDLPKSQFLFMGGYWQHHNSCDDSAGYATHTQGFVHSEPQAYKPYDRGTLYFWAKAGWLQHDTTPPSEHSCSWPCGCSVRIGRDASNYKQWDIPCPSNVNWARYGVDLGQPPQEVSGSFDFEDVGYLRFMFGSGINLCTQCGQCFGNIDYAVLRR